MKKKIISLLLALTLCAHIAPGAAAQETYSDVPAAFWAAEDIYRATQLGIFNGVGDGVFGRGQAISRAAFVTALVRMFGWETVDTQQNTFVDVTSERWFYGTVETAVANGAIPTASQNFYPDSPLRRGDMAAMLMRALGYTSLAGVVNHYDCPFNDVAVNKGFITMAYDMGIVSGMGDGIFDPNAYATREQAAAILVRLYDRLSVQNRELDDAAQLAVLRVEIPEVQEGTELPTTPLEPISELYAALREMKESGQNMSEMVLALCGGGVRTITSTSGEIMTSVVISAEEVSEILARSDVRVYYSQRYESAYCVYEPNDYQTVTVWYQSAESLAIKLQLARMFGVINYVLE